MRLSTIGLIALTLAAAGCSKKDGVSPDPASTTQSAQPAQGAGKGADKGGAAAATEVAALGKPAPDFELSGLGGDKAKLSDHKGKIVVLEWFNPDCPFVKDAHENGGLKGMAARYRDKDVVWLAINSGAAGRQGHGDEANKAGKERFGIDYPILYDSDGKVGRMYGAQRTPHMYVVDKEGTLVYRGALDSTRGDAEDAEGTVNYLADALADLGEGKAVRKAETKAWGCTVKYASR